MTEKRKRGRPKGWRDPLLEDRNAQIVAYYRKGRTLDDIAALAGLTRQRVQQIVHKAGVKAEEGGRTVRAQQRRERLQAQRDQRCLEKYGHTWSEHRQMLHYDALERRRGRKVSRTVNARFRRQRQSMRNAGIPWSLTLAQWWAVWEDSGLWSLCGRGKGPYTLSRIDRTKGYEMGNVVIAEFQAVMKRPRKADIQKRRDLREEMRQRLLAVAQEEG
jgi:hypothetical protein